MPADREEESNADGAEQAFEALRAEIAAMRQAVEFLGKNQPGDTTVTLGEIVKALWQIEEGPGYEEAMMECEKAAGAAER